MTPSCQRILVTGGAGFVGSNIVDSLLAKGFQVTVLDDFYTGHEANLSMNHLALNVVRGSVCDYDLVRKLVGETEIIIHEAARNIIVSTRNPREDYEVNIGGTLNVLMAMRESKVKRMVYSSSASIYGNPRYLPINEDDATNILSPYSVSKYAGEAYCKSFYEAYGLSTTVVRYSNVFGTKQRPDNPYCGVVAKFFNAAHSGIPLPIHGDGEQSRDYTFVSDVVDATILAAFSPKAEGQVYNVGTGRETTVNKLATTIIQVTGSSSKVEHIDRRDIDNIRRRTVNIEKIRKDLRWVPTVTLERGLALTWEWLQRKEAAEKA